MKTKHSERRHSYSGGNLLRNKTMKQGIYADLASLKTTVRPSETKRRSDGLFAYMANVQTIRPRQQGFVYLPLRRPIHTKPRTYPYQNKYPSASPDKPQTTAKAV